ncbi:MAG: prepilin-type N-terminal cleavage/methylation domain-containing protein [Moraxellaceae bacterium]|nr:prepilin-type N-terminal cleavage/methylation domain-containing protein [Pseudobdellovibrionaceae bacterium]
MKKNLESSRGFTLIEVILAMTILSSMMILVSISISRASKAKVKIQAEVEAVSALRDAMRMIRTDINQAYNHYDYEIEITEQSKKKTLPPALPGQPPPPVPPVAPLAPVVSQRKSPATRFVGTENTLDFVTMNNGRMTANDVQADFVEVGYFLKNCTSHLGDAGRGDKTEKSQGSQCLFRRVQKIIDLDVTKGGVETMMIDNVTEFSLKYLIEGKLDWVKEWKAEKARYNIIPDAVEVTLGIEKKSEGKQKKYSIQYVVPIHFPNNNKASGGGPQPPGATSGNGLPTK